MDFFGQSDTTLEAFQKQTEILQKLGPERRMEIMFELSDNLRQTTMAGIRNRHPDYTQRQIVQAWLKMILEPELFKQVFGGCDIEL